MDQNRCFFVGRLVRDPEFHPAGRKGQAHATFTLVVNRVVSNEQGPQADYIPCSLWGEVAKNFCEKRSLGDEVGFFGRIRTSSIPQASGPARHVWEVRVDERTLRLGRRSRKNMAPKPEQTPQTNAVAKLSSEF